MFFGPPVYVAPSIPDHTRTQFYVGHSAFEPVSLQCAGAKSQDLTELLVGQ
jgi:hypothetical protein